MSLLALLDRGVKKDFEGLFAPQHGDMAGSFKASHIGA